MGISLADFGLSSSKANANARQQLLAQKKATSKQLAVTKKGTAQAKEAIEEGYGTAREDLAGPLAAAGRYLTGQQEGYDIGRGALGLTGEQGAADAQRAYELSLQPGYNRGLEDIRRERVGGGRLASGGLATDFYDYGMSKFYEPWRQSVLNMNPLAANQQNFDISNARGGYATGEANALNTLATGNASNLGNIYGTEGANNAAFFGQRAANDATVAGNWGSLASGVLNAGVALAGGPAGSALFGAAKAVPKVPARGFGGFG